MDPPTRGQPPNKGQKPRSQSVFDSEHYLHVHVVSRSLDSLHYITNA